MVRKIINFFGKEIKGLHEAAYLLALFSFMSLLLGLVRDRLLATEFGASAILDVYYTSFRLPDLLFVWQILPRFAITL
jgi:peptidoglycan biosynthesis protein MviN/MurJ (putative lipid II flippase)